MKKTLIAFVLGVGLAASLQAGFVDLSGTVTPGPANSGIGTMEDFVNGLDRSSESPFYGVPDDLRLVARPTVDGVEVNGCGVSGLGDEAGAAWWDSAGADWSEMWLVLVKGGGKDVRIYVVDDAQRQEGRGAIESLINGGGQVSGISHVDFYGRGESVPDGGMMLLLVGLAAGGLGLIRKRQ